MSRTSRIDPLYPDRLVYTSCAETVLELPPGPPADVPTGELTRQQVLDLWPDLEDDPFKPSPHTPRSSAR
jgi:hypothetical protein